MSGHAKLSPSASHRWMNCPGSVRLCAPFPDTTSAAAEEGTFAHNIAADCLDERHRADAKHGHSDGTHTVDDEMVEALQVYVDAVRAAGARCAFRVLRVEESVQIFNDLWGTADALVFADDVLHVFDLKYGAGVLVEADQNPQLMVYALGALKTFAKEDEEIDTIVMHIVQPRHRLGGHSFFEMSREDLEIWGEFELEPAAEEARQSGRKAATPPGFHAVDLFAGDHCRWCRAKATCPEIRAQSLRAAQAVFAGDPEELVTRDAVDVTEMPPEEVAKALDAFPMVEEWMKAVRDHAFELAKRGRAVPGRKLVDKIGNRKWRDEAVATATLKDVAGIDPFVEPKLVSPAQAEKEMKHISPKQRAALMDKLAFKPKTGTALVLNSDKRPARGGSSFDALT